MQDDSAMLAYVKLAELSQERRQLPQRDKFLLLTGISACRAGWLDVAKRCRELVLDNNPAHLIHRFDSIPDALRSPDFAPFHKRLRRFCTYEKAEHLLLRTDAFPFPQESKTNPGDYVQTLLSLPIWTKN